MARKHKKADARGPSAKDEMSRKEYEQKMLDLHAELVKLQTWIKHTGAKIMVLFEGRDAAGKGGVIKRITERVSPRVFKVVALATPALMTSDGTITVPASVSSSPVHHLSAENIDALFDASPRPRRSPAPRAGHPRANVARKDPFEIGF